MGTRSTLPAGIPPVKGEFGRERLQVDIFAVKLQVAVANERAGQQAGLGQDLEPVANAQDDAAVVGKLLARPA